MHRAINNESYLVRQYHIDGEVIPEGKRCDYLVLNDTKKNAYFIELKGSDVNRGIEQLFASIDLIRDDIDEYNIMLRIWGQRRGYGACLFAVTVLRILARHYDKARPRGMEPRRRKFTLVPRLNGEI